MMPDDEGEQLNKKRGLGAALAALMGLQLAPKESLADSVGSGIFGSSPLPVPKQLLTLSPLPRDGDVDPADWTVLMFPLEEIR
jgi:hypothetical protein